MNLLVDALAAIGALCLLTSAAVIGFVIRQGRRQRRDDVMAVADAVEEWHVSDELAYRDLVKQYQEGQQ